MPATSWSDNELEGFRADVASFKMVGPTGEVVGIERDPRSLSRAKTRVAEAGLHNVTFTQCDLNQMTGEGFFDAAVGG